MKQLNITVNNSPVSVYESPGNGIPVFFFHGNSSSKIVYRELLEFNTGDHKFIAVDFPGHGSTPLDAWATGGMSIKRLGEFAHAVISYYGYEEYFVVGQSIGGHALMENPSIMKGALGVCLLSSPPIDSESIELAFNKISVLPLLFQGDLNAHEVRELSRYFIGPAAAELIKIIAHDISNTDSRFRSLLAQSIVDGGISNEITALGEFPRDILMVRGRHDQFLNKAYFGTLKKIKFWNNRIYEFDCGHCISLEIPTKTYSLLLQYINSVIAKENVIKSIKMGSNTHA
jgi:pimeloyl-ACP methyl ester carboxylesterase